MKTFIITTDRETFSLQAVDFTFDAPSSVAVFIDANSRNCAMLSGVRSITQKDALTKLANSAPLSVTTSSVGSSQFDR